MIASNTDPFPAADLETNKSGRLTDTQVARLRGMARAGRKDEFIIAAACVGLAVLLVAGPGSAPNAWIRPLAGAGLLVVAAIVSFRAATAPSALTQDLNRG